MKWSDLRFDMSEFRNYYLRNTGQVYRAYLDVILVQSNPFVSSVLVDLRVCGVPGMYAHNVHRESK